MGPTKIMVDTSAWLALTLLHERTHDQIDDFIKSEQKKDTVLFTTNDIISETITRLVYDNNLQTAQIFISRLNQAIKTKFLVQSWTDELIQQEAFAILEKFRDHKLSLTDATTIVIMRRFNLDAVLTLDSDFKKIGIHSLP